MSWKTNNPPKDGTTIVAIGRVISRDEFSTCVEPFVKAVRWEKDSSGYEGWHLADDGMVLACSLDDKVVIDYWNPMPTARTANFSAAADVPTPGVDGETLRQQNQRALERLAKSVQSNGALRIREISDSPPATCPACGATQPGPVFPPPAAPADASATGTAQAAESPTHPNDQPKAQGSCGGLNNNGAQAQSQKEGGR